jgi:hypothetical protein
MVMDYLKLNASTLIVTDDQQDATILVYLFIPNQLYMLREMISTIIRSIMVASSGATRMRWNCVSPHSFYQPAAISVDNIRSCKFSQMLLMTGENIARNM